MKKRLRFFGLYALYWIIYFLVARLFFIVYQYSFTSALSFGEIVLSFIHGLRMDLSTTGYILALVGLILTITSFTNGKWVNHIIQPFTLIVLILTSLIIITDLELYRNWGYRMDATPLLYITKPKEAMASTELWLEIVLFIFVLVYIFLGWFVYTRKIKPHVQSIEKGKILTPLFLLILTGSMILPVRGSLGIAPMNTGMVYFSEHKFANHAAVNVVWNVMNSLVYRKNQEKTYHFMEDEEAKEIAVGLNKKCNTSTYVVQKKNVNIVFLMLESFSSKVIPELGGKWNAAPNFSKLAKEGILFTNFYANASRSDKGIVSILSGYPGQPTTSIIKTPSKTEKLPSLFKAFNRNGYESYFYYGGDIDFANMRSYFLNAGVKNIISKNNFDDDLNNSKWGVHDEYLFDYLYNDLHKHKEPYFKAIFTLSSHDPFEVPMNPVFEGNDRATKYLNSVYYTDSCLGAFFTRIKQTEVWNNTLFILVADHGSSRPGNSQNHDMDKFKIPMLWLGGVLNNSINHVGHISSQIDIPASLLGQLDLNYDQFDFSKNIFSDKSDQFAFYVFNDGFSFITDSSKVIYDNASGELLYSEGNAQDDLVKGKAYLQYLMNDFISR